MTLTEIEAGQFPTIIYDGDCPFCRSYVRLLRLRDSIGQVELLNAREHPKLVDELFDKGLKLDEGMVLILDRQYYYGSDCIHRLALLSTGSSLFNRFNRLIFRSPRLARAIYPILRAGRNLTLTLLGVDKLTG